MQISPPAAKPETPPAAAAPAVTAAAAGDETANGNSAGAAATDARRARLRGQHGCRFLWTMRRQKSRQRSASERRRPLLKRPGYFSGRAALKSACRPAGTTLSHFYFNKSQKSKLSLLNAPALSLRQLARSVILGARPPGFWFSPWRT